MTMQMCLKTAFEHETCNVYELQHLTEVNATIFAKDSSLPKLKVKPFNNNVMSHRIKITPFLNKILNYFRRNGIHHWYISFYFLIFFLISPPPPTRMQRDICHDSGSTFYVYIYVADVS